METLNQNWQTVSEIELIYKTKIKSSERPQIKSSKDAYKLALSAWDYNKIEFFEQFKVLFMNQAHKAARKRFSVPKHKRVESPVGIIHAKVKSGLPAKLCRPSH